MTDPLPTARYLPFLRRGLATGVGGVTGGRTSVEVTIHLAGGRTATRTLPMAGAGDVTGLGDGVVSRMYPLPDVFDAEPNYFALVEFRQADLPWRYTAASIGGSDGRPTRWLPWLRLIVLTDAEIADRIAPASASRPRPSVTIDNPTAVLPIADQAWAWAHVEVMGADELSVEEAVERYPQRAISRIVCPRRLATRTAYTALLVPVFARGRLAGLGQDPGTTSATTLAWGAAGTSGTTPVELPIYHQWRFGTGAEGDFESLARRLEPRELPTTVGVRSIDVSEPGYGIDAPSIEPMRLESALQPIDAPPPAWIGAERDRFVEQILPRLALANARVLPSTGDGASVRVVASPLYGMWHAQRSGAAVPGVDWFDNLNVNPVLRACAGIAARIVQANDDAFVSAAWRQFETVRQINESLRFAQLAREGADKIYQRDVVGASLDTLFAFAAPLLAQVAIGGSTVNGALAASPVPTGVLDAQWRKLSRPRGPIGLRQRRTDARLRPLLERLNSGELQFAPPPRTPAGMLSFLDTARRLGARVGRDTEAQGITAASTNVAAACQFLIALALASRYARLAARLPPDPGMEAALERAFGRACDADALPDAGPAPSFIAVTRLQNLPAPSATAGPDSESARAFRSALRDFLRDVSADPQPARTATPADLHGLGYALVNALDPRRTIPSSIASRLRLDSRVRRGADPIAPIVGVPDLGIPLYAPLRDISQEWILPGANDVPANTMTLVANNRRFIEAFMAGANHEFSRELLWREFPADLRGTFFRQFWDPGAKLDPATSDAERRRDIRAIHDWPAGSPLGSHSTRPAPPSGEHDVVLLMRGDLLRRYPQTQVYMVTASPDGTGESGPLYPVFSAVLRPEAHLRGFSVTDSAIRMLAARATTSPPSGLQHFIVLEEPVTESRFGLDERRPGGPPTRRDDLAWNHVSTGASGYIDLVTTTLPATPPGEAGRVEGRALTEPAGATGATIAWLTFQAPVRVLIPAADMLPSPPSGGATDA